MKKRILILDNRDSFSHNLRHLFLALSHIDVEVRSTDNYHIDQLEGVQGLVLSPGPGRPDDHPRLKFAIRDAIARIPILGVCLGLQAIVEYYGGTLTQLDEVRHGIKSKLKICDESKLFKNLPSELIVGRYHSFVANKNNLPRNFKVTAIDEYEEIMAVRHNYLPIFALQFHPESYLTNFGQIIAKNFIEEL